jgi:hypothetical protein
MKIILLLLVLGGSTENGKLIISGSNMYLGASPGGLTLIDELDLADQLEFVFATGVIDIQGNSISKGYRGRYRYVAFKYRRGP